jgi:hypothetical protein
VSSSSLTPEQWDLLRRLLEKVAQLEDLRGVPAVLASDAAHFLPLLSHRQHSLDVRRAASREVRGESATARHKRVLGEVRDRDGACAIPGFLGVTCQGAPEMDHFFGKGKAPETTELCWDLCNRHHWHKTKWNPTRLAWLQRFREHAEGLAYYEALMLVDRGIALEIGQHPEHLEVT